MDSFNLAQTYLSQLPNDPIFDDTRENLQKTELRNEHLFFYLEQLKSSDTQRMRTIIRDYAENRLDDFSESKGALLETLDTDTSAIQLFTIFDIVRKREQPVQKQLLDFVQELIDRHSSRELIDRLIRRARQNKSGTLPDDALLQILLKAKREYILNMDNKK